MTIRSSTKFTPEVLLSGPNRSAGIPNADGTKVIYTLSSYSFDKHEKKSEIRVLDVKSSKTTLISDNTKHSNPVWLDGDHIALLSLQADEITKLLVGNIRDFKNEHHTAGAIEGPADNLKVAKVRDKFYVVAVSAQANPNGTVFNPSYAPKRHTTGRLYRSLYVRHWDTYVSPQRNTIFGGVLLEDYKNPDHMMVPLFVNLLQKTRLESPVPPFGGKDNFDISAEGLIFVAKDPDIDPALNTRCKLYLELPETRHDDGTPGVIEVSLPEHLQGALTCPVFSPDGSKAAFFGMNENGYESDKNRVYVIPEVKKDARVVQLMGKRDWDHSPNSVQWAGGDSLVLTAEAYGQNTVFSCSADPDSEEIPYAIQMAEGSVSSVKMLAGDSSTSEQRIFISGTSLVENSLYLIDTLPKDLSRNIRDETIKIFPSSRQKVSYLTGNGNSLGLSKAQITELWSPSAAYYRSIPDQPKFIHSWVVRPSNFDQNKKYPLAFFIHGGPQGAWLNSWSTRWNPAVFAEQGYVVVCPNPTGSTGYGQNLTDAIKEKWGDLPYVDLLLCFQHIERELDFVDIDKAVALGASYGGYMINWIQGQPLGRRFKALVCHDGMFSCPFSLATDELFFNHHDFGSEWSADRSKWWKWSPDLHTQNWKTPQLVIHSEKDYRLSMADGLATFNILQTQGVESEFLTFADENHWVLNPENSLVWHETVLNFINKHVGLPPYKEKDDKGVVQDPPRPSNGSNQRSIDSSLRAGQARPTLAWLGVPMLKEDGAPCGDGPKDSA